MKVIFLGTRGGIKARSAEHYQHASLLLEEGHDRIMIDCGTDWLAYLNIIQPTAVIITHAHADHVGGLKCGAPCPVYATGETFDRIKRYPLSTKITITPCVPFDVGGIEFVPFALEHSLHAPAVGYRITHGKQALFYAPDIVSIIKQKTALHDVSLYIGDGALIDRTLLIRKHEHERTGHTSIREQLSWCQKAGIPSALITHCGTEIVTGQPSIINEKIAQLGITYDVSVKLAYDGLIINLT